MTALKQAFLDGAREALARHGIGHKKEKSTLRKALPWLAAGAAGAGTYKFLRTPSFSKNPAMRALQERAVGGGLRRIVDVTPREGSHWLHPQANSEGNLSMLDKLKMFIGEGTTHGIPIVNGENGLTLANGQKSMNVNGVVQGRPAIEGMDKLVRGGADIEGPKKTQRALTRLAQGGKREEAEFLHKHAPGAMPETVTDLSHLFHDLPKDRHQAAAELQSRLLSNHGENLMLKPNIGLASSGKFPHTGGDWAEQLRAYDAHMASPEGLKKYTAADEEGGNYLAKYLKSHGLYEGHVLHQALSDPRSVVAQRRIDNILGEYRIHSIAGEAPSNMAFHKGKAGEGVKGNVDVDGMRRYVEDTVKKLPSKYQKGNYGFDIMEHYQPDGSRGYKVLEMNPTESALSADEAGGGSGYVDPESSPLSGHMVYRAATGRHTPLLAGAVGAGAAGLGGLGVHALTEDKDK